MRHEGGGVGGGGSSRAGSVSSTRKIPARPLSTHGGSVSTLNDNQSEVGDYSGPKLYVQVRCLIRELVEVRELEEVRDVRKMST